ncbi:hypothetical protein F1728_10895 [Gimesia benthica]|uniref:Uncharacterized protein n=1 Tax=Gimesia benthica TaxID=2608982 RepID=A0A6I6ACM3_9PLAN|nr:hypothetical protein [Gimesia benthica]QGQ23145.1 hypothetical protein F1728_10895 [Gimesia benthica]
MDWFTFLILLLTASLTALAVWWAIQKWFRVESESIVEDSASIAGSYEAPQHALYWNFTTVLIAVCILLLVLGISVQTTSLRDPITWTLGAALLLSWGMALWSGMLTAPKKPQTAPVPSDPELTIYAEQESASADDPNPTEAT